MSDGLLAGRVAVVTGGSSGIGLAIAKRLAREGARVAAVASRDLAKAQAACAQITALGGQAEAFVADVADAQDVGSLAAAVAERLGRADILINAAGVWEPTPLAEMSEDQIDRMIDVNLKGVIRTTAVFAPKMIERGGGRIVNIASIAGIVASPGYSLYSTAKAGVIAFTKAAALELALSGVAVNAIAPGNTATPINHDVRTAPEFAARRDWISRITPSSRSFTPAEEIAEVALFLTDGRVNGMHGAVVSVDEGRSAGLTARLG